MIDKKYYLVTDRDTVNLLVQHIDQSETIAYDTETNSLNPRKGKVVGFSVSGDIGIGFYMPTMIWNPVSQTLDECTIDGVGCHTLARKILSKLKGKKLVMHNASFDIRFTKNFYDVDLLDDLWIDTPLLVHTVKEEGAFGFGASPFGLKSIAIMVQQEIGLDVEEAANKEQIELKESIKANGGAITKDNFEIFKADMEILGMYAAADTDLTLRICNHFLGVLKEENLENFFFNEEVMPLYKEVTIPMEELGVALDVNLIEQTRNEIQADLQAYKKKVFDEMLVMTQVREWIVDTSLKNYPPSNRGNWVQTLIEKHNLDLPQNAKGRYSISAKAVSTLPDSPVKTFIQTGDMTVLDEMEVLKVSIELWRKDNDGEYFNIQSKRHLGEIAFDYMKIKPLSNTDKGLPQFDDDFIQTISDKHTWAENLRIYNKLLKISSTYVDRFYYGAEDGRYYFYFKQNGTVSGRYGSDAQQLPKPKEDGEAAPIIIKYNNIVRAFLVAEEGRLLIDADYESLEPHCFASVSGDKNLQDIFNNGWDFYSTVAIKTEKLEERKDLYPDGVSPDKKSPVFLKKLDPVKRNRAKGYALGIAYGMEAYALSMGLGVSQAEAEELVEGYLNGFPQLKEWRINSRKQVKERGFIVNKVGRIRHLPKVKKIYETFGDQIMDWRYRKELEKTYGKDQVMAWYRDYRNGLNNCLNYQLQSLAAAVVNRAAIQINRYLKANNIDGRVQAQIHDQLIINVPEDQAKEVAPAIQKIMEVTTQLEGVTLKAPPELAKNFRDGH
jgi:DNA polymerase I-like protein with 3'-5' exonuclease and polymerase domains